MIVKKTPILQGFPASGLVKDLSLPPASRAVFLDIETNGLSAFRHFAYLIGAMDFSDNLFTFYQWFAQSPEEEPVILQALTDFLAGGAILVHFNGSRFDLPFLEARFAAHQMSAPFAWCPSLDLCRELKPLQTLLGLPNRKCATAEAFLGLGRTEDCSGKECIHLYQKYYATGRMEFAEPILRHNRLDLENLPYLSSLLRYRQILEGNYRCTALRQTEDGLEGTFQLEDPVPKPLSFDGTEARLTAEGSSLLAAVPFQEGRLKLYHAPYRDYYYLPEEDTAVHKSVGVYVDKSRRKAATERTCYTWFSPQPSFLEDKEQVQKYFHENLGQLLGLF